jgi:hypothetical protein
MKLKYLLYGLFAASFVFAVTMAYLFYSSAPASEPGTLSLPEVQDRSRTASGKAGQLVIAYSGDMNGNLDPCG